MGAVQDDLITRLDLVGLGSYTSGIGQAADALGLLSDKTSEAEKKQIALGIAAGAIAAGAGTLIKGWVEAAGEMEQTEIGFQSILGSADATEKKIAELQAFAARSPFDFAGSADSARQLLAMGIAADQLIPIMDAAGNAVSAAGGKNKSDTFKGVLTALGQIKTRGRASAEEFNQLAQRGIPAYEILREELGLTQDQLGALGNQGIEADRAINALVRGFNRRFPNAMEQQSRTLLGSFSSLADVSGQLAASFGSPLIGPITTVTRGVTGLLDSVNRLDPAIKGAVGVIATVGTVGLVVYSGATLWAATQTVFLAKAHLAAAESARKQAEEEKKLAAATATAGATAAGAGLANAAGGAAGAGAGAAAAGAGFLAKAGKFSKPGAIGAAGLLAALGLSFLPDEGGVGVFKRFGEGAATGAGLGGAAGSIIPGLGTAAGAIIGALLGGAIGLATGPKSGAGAGADHPQLAKIADLLEEQNALLRKGLPFNTGDIPAARQLEALGALKRARSLGA